MAPASSGVAMQVIIVSLNLAKNVFQVHGVTEDGTVAFNHQLRRAQLIAFFRNLGPCLVGMEACEFGHHWARELSKLDHLAKVIAPIHIGQS